MPVRLTACGGYYATIYKTNPSGALVPSGVDLTQAQAAQLQSIAWEVVSNYRYNGF